MAVRRIQVLVWQIQALVRQIKALVRQLKASVRHFKVSVIQIQVAVRGPKVVVCALEVAVCEFQGTVRRIQMSPQSGLLPIAQPFMAGDQERKKPESAKRTTDSRRSAVRFTDLRIKYAMVPPINRWAITIRPLMRTGNQQYAECAKRTTVNSPAIYGRGSGTKES